MSCFQQYGARCAEILESFLDQKENSIETYHQKERSQACRFMQILIGQTTRFLHGINKQTKRNLISRFPYNPLYLQILSIRIWHADKLPKFLELGPTFQTHFPIIHFTLSILCPPSQPFLWLVVGKYGSFFCFLFLGQLRQRTHTEKEEEETKERNWWKWSRRNWR